MIGGQKMLCVQLVLAAALSTALVGTTASAAPGVVDTAGSDVAAGFEPKPEPAPEPTCEVLIDGGASDAIVSQGPVDVRVELVGVADADAVEVRVNGRVDDAWVLSEGDENPGALALEKSFSAEGEYEVAVLVDGETLATRFFVIDRTPPVIEVAFVDDGEDGADEDGDAEKGDGAEEPPAVEYYSCTRTATVRVVEKHFDESLVEVGGTGVPGDWETSGDVHTLSVRFADEGAQSLTVAARDAARNAAEPYEATGFVIDLTAPAVSFTVDQTPANNWENIDYFNARATVTAHVADASLDESSLADSVLEASGAQSVGAWAQDVDGSWSRSATFAEGAGHAISLRVRDLAGNEGSAAYGTATSDADGNPLAAPFFAVDETAPTVSVLFSGTEPSGRLGQTLFYNAPVAAEVSLADTLGLASARLEGAGSAYDGVLLGSAGQDGAAARIDLVEGQAFDGAASVFAVDLAGNVGTWDAAGTSRLVDATAPVLVLAGAEEGKIYAGTRTVTLTVEELNLPYLLAGDAGQVVLTVTRTDVAEGNKAQVGEFVTTRTAGDLKRLDGRAGDTWGLAVELAQDGRYVVEASLTDPAGNAGEARVGEFTIDSTAPVIEVSFDNEDVRNDKYYNAPRTATVAVRERNFDSDLMRIETNGAQGAWSTNGDVHTLDVFFSGDGTYSLAVFGADAAGNEAEPFVGEEFVVDATPPSVQILGVADACAYAGDVEPQVCFDDAVLLDEATASVSLVGSMRGKVEPAASPAADPSGSGLVWELGGISYQPGNDDVYALEAEVSDMAGNVARAEATFSVNRFGSTFRVVNAAELEAAGGYLAGPPEVVVEEVNVSGTAFGERGVVVSRGLDVTALEEVGAPSLAGFSTEETGPTGGEPAGWSTRTYRIHSGNFAKEGRYRVSVTSRDLAGNLNTSSGFYDREQGGESVAEVEFAVDVTDPEVANMSVAAGDVIEADVYEGSFTVVENMGLADVEATLDGEKLDLAAGGHGNYAFAVPAKAGVRRTLEVRARDLAGRSCEVAVSGFEVTNDTSELRVRDTAARGVALLCAGVAVAAFSTARRMVRRR